MVVVVVVVAQEVRTMDEDSDVAVAVVVPVAPHQQNGTIMAGDMKKPHMMMKTLNSCSIMRIVLARQSTTTMITIVYAFNRAGWVFLTFDKLCSLIAAPQSILLQIQHCCTIFTQWSEGCEYDAMRGYGQLTRKVGSGTFLKLSGMIPGG
jgi:hypothetical protein